MKINFDYITVTLSITVLVVLACDMYVSYRQWDFDGSYIVYRIVKNIINGHGWVCTIGESRNASTSVLNIDSNIFLIIAANRELLLLRPANESYANHRTQQCNERTSDVVQAS